MANDHAAHEFDVRQVIPKDEIPSIDDPAYAETYDGGPDDEVIVVEVEDLDAPDGTSRAVDGSPTRAYPIRYLHYHEIVNDELGGVPIAVTWCPLCGSAVVYDRRVDADSEGERTLEFGVSGKLADDDLVMYDRETGSEWKQSLGTAIAGSLKGTELRALPAALTTWRRARTAYPDADVLSAPGGESEAAGEGSEAEPIDYDAAPYEAYFETDGFGLAAHRGAGSREWDREDVAPKAVVLGIEVGDAALGVPLPEVLASGDGERGVVTATVGDRDVVVFAGDGGIHAFADPGYDWALAPGGFRATRADGSGALYEGSAGRPVDAPAAHTGEAGGIDAGPLERVPTRRLFAFAWRDDHGDSFYTSPGDVSDD